MDKVKKETMNKKPRKAIKIEQKVEEVKGVEVTFTKDLTITLKDIKVTFTKGDKTDKLPIGTISRLSRLGYINNKEVDND